MVAGAAGQGWNTYGLPYAIDNGAWRAHVNGAPFDVGAFEQIVERLGQGAEWVVLPDIVAGGRRSLEFSESWLSRVDVPGWRLLAVQDGMAPADVRPLLTGRVGIFLGGSTEWKLATMPEWGHLAREVGCHYHVARVNSRKRIRLVQLAGAHSFDGTSVTRFACTLPRLDAARKQITWLIR